MKRQAAQTLFESIGQIDDDLIEEAQEPLLMIKHPKWNRWIAAAACVGIVFLCGAAAMQGMFHCGSSGGWKAEEGLERDRSFGPIFPLSVLEPDVPLTAVRETEFDFSPYADSALLKQPTENSFPDWYGKDAAAVIDRYTLTNPTNTDQEVTLLYPFCGEFLDSADRVPQICVDGIPQQIKLMVDGKFGSESEIPVPQNVSFPDTWQEYLSILDMGMIREHTALQQLDVPVIVYEITNGTEPINEQVRIELTIDADSERTQFLSNRINGISIDEKTGKTVLNFDEFMRSESRSATKAQLIVIGEDIREMHSTGKVLKNDRWVSDERVSYEIDRFETTLSQELTVIVQAYYTQYAKEMKSYRGTILSQYADETVLLDALAENLWYQHQVLGIPYHVGMLQYGRGETILYASVSVTIPADSSIHITASMLKYPGILHGKGSETEKIHRFDLVQNTKIPITKATATLRNPQFISIVSQNFGFDPQNGVLQVTLDPSVEHYYMDVSKIETEDGMESE